MNKKFTQDIIQHFHRLHKAPQFAQLKYSIRWRQNIEGVNDVVFKDFNSKAGQFHQKEFIPIV